MVNPIENFNGYLRVEDENQTLLYAEIYNQDEAASQATNFCQTYGKSLEAPKFCLVPLRTDNFLHFSIDLFCPTIEILQNIENVVGKIFIFIGGIIFDLLTFPIRLIALPVILLSSSSKPHPILQILQGHIPANGKLTIIVGSRKITLGEMGFANARSSKLTKEISLHQVLEESNASIRTEWNLIQQEEEEASWSANAQSFSESQLSSETWINKITTEVFSDRL